MNPNNPLVRLLVERYSTMSNEDRLEAAKNAGKGFAAGIPGQVGDLANMAGDLVRYSQDPSAVATEMATGDFMDYQDRIGTTDALGKLLGADIDSGEFIAGSVGVPDMSDLGKAMFLGVAGANRLRKAGKADEMVEAGVGAIDKKPRFEISDADVELKPWTPPEEIGGKFTGFPKGTTVEPKLEDVIDHPALFEAYPDLRDINVARGAYDEVGSRYEPGANRIVIGGKAEDPLGDLLHEIQHPIQRWERHAGGASAAQEKALPKDEVQRALYHAVTDTMTERGIDPIKARTLGSRMSEFKAYDDAAGEIEAEATRFRREMNLDERGADQVTNRNPSQIKRYFDALGERVGQDLWGAIDEKMKASQGDDWFTNRHRWSQADQALGVDKDVPVDGKKIEYGPGATPEDVARTAAADTGNPDRLSEAQSALEDMITGGDPEGYRAAIKAEDDAYEALLTDPDRLKALARGGEDEALGGTDPRAALLQGIADARGLRVLRDRQERDALQALLRDAPPEEIDGLIDEAFDLGSARERAARRGIGVVDSEKLDVSDVLGPIAERNAKGGAPVDFEDRPGSVVSARFPTAVKSTEDPLADILMSDLDALRQYPDELEKRADLFRDYPMFEDRLKNAGPEETIEEVVNFQENNLRRALAEYDPEKAERASYWYEGANKISNEIGDRLGVDRDLAAAVVANTSPGTLWDENVARADRMLQILTGAPRQWDESMQAAWDAKKGAPWAQKPELAGIEGRNLDTAENDKQRAILGFLTDQARKLEGDDRFRAALPEGEYGDLYPRRYSTASPNQWEKGVSLLDDPSQENISRSLGGAHKVRNFFSNIVSPMSPGFYTGDTHDVAAKLFSPHGQAAREVGHNFGVGGKSSISGLGGTYAINQEAGMRLADEYGVLPRQVQSPSWEAIRALMPKEVKKAGNQDATAEIWRQYGRGEISQSEAQDLILKLLGSSP